MIKIKDYFNKTIIRLIVFKVFIFSVFFLLIFNINPFKPVNYIECPVNAQGGFCHNPFYDNNFDVDPVNNLPELLPAGFTYNEDKVFLVNLMNGCILFIIIVGLLINHIFYFNKRNKKRFL